MHWFRLLGSVAAERYDMTADDERWLSTLHVPSSRGCPSLLLCNQTNPPETRERGMIASQEALGPGHQGLVRSRRRCHQIRGPKEEVDQGMTRAVNLGCPAWGIRLDSSRFGESNVPTGCVWFGRC